MCGRFVMARAVGDLVAETGALPPEEELVLPAPNWNVPPTADVKVVLERAVEADQLPDDGHPVLETGSPQVRREIHVARWGLVPIWAKDLSVGVRAFNARSETVTEKPTFRSAVRARRCAIPVDGYYEWLKPAAGEKGPDGKAAKKRPFYVHRPDGGMIFFAGLYEWWKDPAVAEGEPGQWVLSCTILTGPSPSPAPGTRPWSSCTDCTIVCRCRWTRPSWTSGCARRSWPRPSRPRSWWMGCWPRRTGLPRRGPCGRSILRWAMSA